MQHQNISTLLTSYNAAYVLSQQTVAQIAVLVMLFRLDFSAFNQGRYNLLPGIGSSTCSSYRTLPSS